VSSKFESLTGTLNQDFPEYDRSPQDPLDLAARWIAGAVEEGVREPLALSLATTDAMGHASNRIVAVLDYTMGGLTFTSHATSRKGREIAETGWASGLFYWREIARQLVLSGPVRRLPDGESDRLWRARATPLHAMSTVSWQSDPLTDTEELRRAAELLGTTAQPRPERFVGYRLAPDSVEFWSAAADRLHRRLRYDRTPTGWRVARLQP
jgi:dihydrophenazinedicarboxylate synthase